MNNYTPCAYTGDKFSDIKKRLRAIGYDGRLTIEMLQMGAVLLEMKEAINVEQD